MESLVQIAQNYGPFGMIILALFWYIVYRDKAHREDQKEMREMMQRQHEEALQVTRNNTTVLTEISTLIRDRKGR